MSKKSFSIFKAVKKSYIFIAKEWKYLIKLSLLPIAINIIISMFIKFGLNEPSLVESYLWSLPSAVVFGWFVFVTIRLVIFGERITNLPKEPAVIYKRIVKLKLTVISSVLFSMVTMAFTGALFLISRSELWGHNMAITFLGLFIIGALFWGVRFGVVPILFAIGYPIKKFLNHVRGPIFSFQLLAMGLLSLIPILFLFQIMISSIIGQPETMIDGFKLSSQQDFLLIIISAPLSLLMNLLLNVSAVFALKELLGSEGE